MDFKCEAEFLGRREVRGSLSVKTISENVRVLFVSALQKGSTTRICKLPVQKVILNLDGLYVSGAFKSSLTNIIFCHIDEKNKRLLVLVTRLKSADDDSAAGFRLETFVWKCQSIEDANSFFRTFQELRQKYKMTRYVKHVKRLAPKPPDDGQFSAVSSDSAIDSSPCPSTASSSNAENSPNISSDECSDSVTSETPSESRKCESLDSDESSGQDSANFSALSGSNVPTLTRQTKPRSRSVPASRILKEYIDKDGMEHKHVISSASVSAAFEVIAIVESSSDNDEEGTLTRDNNSERKMSNESNPSSRTGRSRQRQVPRMIANNHNHWQRSQWDSNSLSSQSIDNVVRKLIPRDIRRANRDRSLPRDTTGIVSFSTCDNNAIYIPNCAPGSPPYVMKSCFDPKRLPQQTKWNLHYPAGNLAYKQWRQAAGLDKTKNLRSPFHIFGRHLADSKKNLMNAFRRPLGVKRSNSVTSQESNGSDSGNDGKLRSVMKKGQASSCIETTTFGNIDGQHDKKNVTFNALTRVQVVDYRI